MPKRVIQATLAVLLALVLLGDPASAAEHKKEGGEGAAAQLRALLMDADPEVACSAAEGIATLGNFDNVNSLIKSLSRFSALETRQRLGRRTAHR